MYRSTARWLCAVCISAAMLPLAAQTAAPVRISVDWPEQAQSMRTTPTLQVVVNPLLRRGSPIHDETFAALRSLGADKGQDIMGLLADRPHDARLPECD